ncbi:AmmeMemoRadiSam system radical SAM enzyme [Methanobacterium aggregans]|uniref:AmmeMemoRadiSam system radical SAM enzyme n=1 Tax=Methanobacterium aggregans TaxID=1615586 RepID=UPI001AE8B231|nr:AmmeMemoRadiSam system radical SAM enzyme [Methanobacterium aggregans]MBP2045874.1 pyruvate formate lyase activating enzyme [Methanobacterium aggregans]
MKKEAILYEKIGKSLNCKVCQRRCIISDGKKGFCNMRRNEEGKLYSLNYAAASSVSVDPIEKKPLFHFYPGSTSLSLGTLGCNFRCKHCQNWTISQADLGTVPTQEIFPEEAVRLAKEYRCGSISWTYNEPTMWFEYTLDSAKLAQKENIKTVYVTNGYMTEEALDLLSPYLDAANVDLKGMSDHFYHELCDARLQPVLETIKSMHELGIHLEVTNLMIPSYNDSDDDVKALVNFMVEEVGVEVPLHFTRFFPYYKLDHLPPTEIATLEKAHKMAKDAGMRYVYVGNVPFTDGENTYCPECGELIIERDGFEVVSDKVKNGKCSKCGAGIDIIV